MHATKNKCKYSSSFSVESLLARDGKAQMVKRKCSTTTDLTHGSSEPDRYQREKSRQLLVTASNGVAMVNDVKFGNVGVALENGILWNVFRRVGTEMVITKSGRGLNPHKQYSFEVEISPADNFRYKYHDSKWRITGKAYTDSERLHRTCTHADSPSSGRTWTSTVVSFHKMKVTNNSNGHQKKHVVLNSLQKYQPLLHIIEYTQGNDDNSDTNDQSKMTVVFPETVFMAVTAYQSEQMTQLKIDNNPFAKGFRVPNPSQLERPPRLLNQSLYELLLSNNHNNRTKNSYHYQQQGNRHSSSNHYRDVSSNSTSGSFNNDDTHVTSVCNCSPQHTASHWQYQPPALLPTGGRHDRDRIPSPHIRHCHKLTRNFHKTSFRTHTPPLSAI